MKDLSNIMGIKEFAVGEGNPPKTFFPIDGAGTQERVARCFTKLFELLGGIDNLVFYPTDNEIYNTDKIYPVYSTEDYKNTEAVVKVINIGNVHDNYKLQVEEEG